MKVIWKCVRTRDVECRGDLSPLVRDKVEDKEQLIHVFFSLGVNFFGEL